MEVVNEFLSLTRFSYDPTENTLTGGLKTESGKNRVVPVSDKALPYLLKWLDKGGEYIICRDQNGKLAVVTMGSYGIGVTRAVAARGGEQPQCSQPGQQA